MKEYIKLKTGKVLLLIVELFFLLMVSTAIIKNVVVIFTAVETEATILSIEDNIGVRPYKIRLNYYNKYSKEDLDVIEVCKLSFVKTLSVGSKVYIVYGKWFENNVYLKDYDNPTLGKILMLILSEIILISVTCLSIKSLGNW